MLFNNEGPENTEQALTLAFETAQAEGIRHMVVATTGGHVAERAAARKPNGLSVVAVTHAQGFKEPGKNEMPDAIRAAVEAAGVRVLTGSHALSGGERGITAVSGGLYPLEIVAYALRMLGQGTKVCVEIAVMALDAGLIPYGERIVAVAGTGSGADTVLVLTPSHAKTLLETRIHRVICKPAL